MYCASNKSDVHGRLPTSTHFQGRVSLHLLFEKISGIPSSSLREHFGYLQPLASFVVKPSGF
jgi:hypothetical protein